MCDGRRMSIPAPPITDDSDDPRDVLLSNLLTAAGLAAVLREVEMNQMGGSGPSPALRDMVSHWEDQAKRVAQLCLDSGIDPGTVRAAQAQAHRLTETVTKAVDAEVRRLEPLDPGRCPARRTNGSQCGQRAGYGTTHPGEGCCRMHGGSAPKRWL